MQMLAAGGISILTDGLREPDEDNPRGYLEFEPVKNLVKDSRWLLEGRGKAVKIVAPLLTALPQGLACRVILSDRDLDEVLDSQQKMLMRRNQRFNETPERRRMLRGIWPHDGPCEGDAFAAPGHATPRDGARQGDFRPLSAARKVNECVGGGLDVVKMAAASSETLRCIVIEVTDW